MDRVGEHRLPLSEAQQGIWLGQQLDESGVLYNAGECLLLRGPLDRGLCLAAFRTAIAEAESLHVRIAKRQQRYYQLLCPQPQVEVECLDFKGRADPLAELQALGQRYLGEPFDAERGILYRAALVCLGRDEHALCLCAHHVALDGYGFMLVLRRVAELYNAACSTSASAPAVASPRSAPKLAAVIAEDLSYHASEHYSDDRRFWLSKLTQHGRLPPARLYDGAIRSVSTPRRLQAPVPAQAMEVLIKRGRAAGVGWAEVLLARLATLMYDQTGVRTVWFGLPLMGRMGSVALRVPCMTMNIVPLCIDAGLNEIECVRSVSAALRRARPHGRYRYEHLRRDLRSMGHDPMLFGPVVNLLPFAQAIRFGHLQTELVNWGAGPVEDLSFVVRMGSGTQQSRFELDANPSAYTEDEQRSLLQETLLGLTTPRRAGVRCSPELPSWPVVGTPRGLLYGPALSEPVVDVVAALYQQVLCRPQAVALCSAARRITYEQLWQLLSARVAELRACGVRRGQLVAILLPRGEAVLVTLLACLQLGAAYLPLDPAGPEGRLQAVLQDADPQLVVHAAQSDLSADIAPGVSRLACAEPLAMALDATVLAPQQYEDHELAYMIYTSGSTGEPNGVRVGRGALAHFVTAARAAYAVGVRDVWLQFATLQFDASVEEIFLALTSGARLVLWEQSGPLDLAVLMAYCETHQVTVLDLPTALFHELARALSHGQVVLPPHVRTVIIGGEAAHSALAERFVKLAPQVQLFNSYGPTEATVVSSCGQLDLKMTQESTLSIGKPLPGTGMAIIDATGRLAESGELWLMGPQLALGYHRRPTLQRARFKSLGACAPAGGSAPRAYRTGDRVSLACDGSLRFVGRVDDELKISGQRVDPREVEQVLLRHADVQQVCVVAEPASLGAAAHLRAYWVGEESAATALRTHCQRYLLSAAVPRAFTRLQRLPLSANGKVDRRALIARRMGAELGGEEPMMARSLDNDARAERSRAPSQGLLRAVLDCYERSLELRGLGTEDDFFALGGQSLQAIQVMSELGALLDRELPVSTLFRHPQAGQLARALQSPSWALDAEREALQRMRVDATLPARVAPRAVVRARRLLPNQAVLITGGSGFVGAHVLSTLLRRHDGPVICLVRAADRAQAYERLLHAQRLHGAGGGLPPQRIEVVLGDLQLPLLGLTQDAFASLATRSAAIIHSAASVSLARGYGSLRAANALGTRAMLELACHDEPIPFLQVSTLALALGAVPTPEGQVVERFVDDGTRLHDGYCQSKWVAERLCEQAYERGLPLSVVRLGRVVGARQKPTVPTQDVFFRLLRAALPRGLRPDLAVEEPWTPVDVAAEILVELALQGRIGVEPVGHLAGTTVRWRDLYEMLADIGYGLRPCTVPELCARLQADADPEDLATLSFLQRLVSANDTCTHLPSHTFAVAALERLLPGAAEKQPAIDAALFRGYVQAAVDTGWLPPN